MRRVALFVALLLCGCYNQFSDASKGATTVSVVTNSTIKYLHQLIGDRDYVDITSDLVVSGYVTATDESGNFYKSFVIQQGEYAIEVLEGLTNSYVRHQEGSLVVLKLSGLRLSRYNSVLQVGLAAEDGSSWYTTYMSHEAIVDQYVICCGGMSPVTPRVITLNELMYGDGETLSPTYSEYGALVQIDGLTLDADSLEVVTWSGTNTFIDGDGLELECYTSSYANYADELVPHETLSMVGILQSSQESESTTNSVMIKMRSIYDCI